MLLYKKYNIFLLMLSVFMIVGCNKKDIDGREIASASSALVLIDTIKPSDVEPDFTNEAIYFTSKFSEEVTATITITGLESGATKVISVDKTSQLDSLNASWNGNHDGLYFFKTGEQVLLELSFYGSELIDSDTLVIAKSYDFVVEDVTFDVPNGDFESENAAWWVDGVSTFWNSTFGLDIPAVQGDYFLYSEGIRTSEGAYIGGASSGARNGDFYELPFDASRVWVNVYAHGFGPSNSHTNYIVSFHEADSIGLEEPNLTNAVGRDDNMGWQIPMDHTGWELKSIRYSDIPFPTYCVPGVEGGGCGNKVRESNRIDLISVSFESDEEIMSYGAIDFIVFTLDRPLDPSKF